MRTFTLRAYRANGTYATELFFADNDRDAIACGALTVMRKAYPNVEPWANGRIELINDMGVVLEEMGAKW